MAQTLGEIKSLLAAHGLRPKHRFGQNFLHDANQMRRIMEAAELREGELVLEVGPGTGALTERLLEGGARVVAVEVDRDLEPILRERLASYGERFTLIVEDVLAGKHELNPHVVEAVRQLRHEAGQYQVPGIQVSMTNLAQTDQTHPIVYVRGDR